MKQTINLPIPMERKLFFSEDVEQESMKILSKSIIDINESDRELEKLYPIYDLEYKNKPIEIYIDSNGGSVYSVYGLVSVMTSSITPVHTICTGLAASTGFFILINGHKRFGYNLSSYLYHQISGGVWGKIQDIEETALQYNKLQNKKEEVIIKRTNITLEQLKENRERKIDWWMTSEEALKLNIIDEIIK